MYLYRLIKKTKTTCLIKNQFMKKIFLSYLFVCATAIAFTQTTNLKSKVVEKDSSTPVAGAIVAINGTSLAETTNREGSFMINNIPLGEQIVTVTKKGYETKIFILNIEKGFLSKIDKIEVKVTKKLRKAREKLKKQEEKEREEKLKKVKNETKKAAKEREKLEKELTKQQEKEIKKQAKEAKKRKKEIEDLVKNGNGGTKIEYIPMSKPEDNQTVSIEDTDVNIVEPISEIQKKYAGILAIEPSEIENKKLYEFIEKWTGITYLNGGETKDGIDCSSFTQRLYTRVYDRYIERTANKQYHSRFNDEFSDKTYLEEGDLVFFHPYKDPETISHVGIYLQNNKFVHSTSSKAKNGLSGVQISDLTDPKWSKRFYAAGKRTPSDN